MATPKPQTQIEKMLTGYTPVTNPTSTKPLPTTTPKPQTPIEQMLTGFTPTTNPTSQAPIQPTKRKSSSSSGSSSPTPQTPIERQLAGQTSATTPTSQAPIPTQTQIQAQQAQQKQINQQTQAQQQKAVQTALERQLAGQTSATTPTSQKPIPKQNEINTQTKKLDTNKFSLSNIPFINKLTKQTTTNNNNSVPPNNNNTPDDTNKNKPDQNFLNRINKQLEREKNVQDFNQALFEKIGIQKNEQGNKVIEFFKGAGRGIIQLGEAPAIVPLTVGGQLALLSEAAYKGYGKELKQSFKEGIKETPSQVKESFDITTGEGAVNTAAILIGAKTEIKTGTTKTIETIKTIPEKTAPILSKTTEALGKTGKTAKEYGYAYTADITKPFENVIPEPIISELKTAKLQTKLDAQSIQAEVVNIQVRTKAKIETVQENIIGPTQEKITNTLAAAKQGTTNKITQPIEILKQDFQTQVSGPVKLTTKQITNVAETQTKNLLPDTTALKTAKLQTKLDYQSFQAEATNAKVRLQNKIETYKQGIQEKTKPLIKTAEITKDVANIKLSQTKQQIDITQKQVSNVAQQTKDIIPETIIDELKTTKLQTKLDIEAAKKTIQEKQAQATYAKEVTKIVAQRQGPLLTKQITNLAETAFKEIIPEPIISEIKTAKLQTKLDIESIKKDTSYTISKAPSKTKTPEIFEQPKIPQGPKTTPTEKPIEVGKLELITEVKTGELKQSKQDFPVIIGKYQTPPQQQPYTEQPTIIKQPTEIITTPQTPITQDQKPIIDTTPTSPITKPSSTPTTTPKRKTSTTSKPSTTPIINVTPDTTPIIKTTPTTSITQKQEQIQDQKQKQEQRQQLILQQQKEEKQKIFPLLTPGPKTKTIEQGFNVFIKEQGQFKKANIRPLSEQDAINLGRYKTATTSKASFKLEKARGAAEDKFGIKTNANIFTTSKKDKNIIVEKTKYRINTPGELTEITKKGQLSQKKTKGIFNKDQKIRTKKGIFG